METTSVVSGVPFGRKDEGELIFVCGRDVETIRPQTSLHDLFLLIVDYHWCGAGDDTVTTSTPFDLYGEGEISLLFRRNKATVTSDSPS